MTTFLHNDRPPLAWRHPEDFPRVPIPAKGRGQGTLLAFMTHRNLLAPLALDGNPLSRKQCMRLPIIYRGSCPSAINPNRP